MSRFTSFILCAVFLCVPLGANAAQAQFGAQDSATTTTVPSATSVYVYDLENDPSQCLNSMPSPNCGKKPQLSGDRGGAMQYAVFFTMLSAVGLIATVIIRNIIRRDRAIAQALEKSDD